MTNNQLSYLTLKENQRSNMVKEQETKRSNLVRERQTRKANREILRHNLVTEDNQAKETAAGITRSQISASASRYGADAAATASRYAADSAAAASRYSADVHAKSQGYATDVTAQTNLTMKYIEKQIQAARDKTNKAINDDKLNADMKKQQLKNASDQFIAAMNKEMKKYEIDKRTQVEYDKIKSEIAQTIIKGAFDNLDDLLNQLSSILLQVRYRR